MRTEDSLYFIKAALEKINGTLENIADRQVDDLASPTITRSGDAGSNTITIGTVTGAEAYYYSIDGKIPTKDDAHKYDSNNKPSLTAKKTVMAFASALNKDDSQIVAVELKPQLVAPTIVCANNEVTMTAASGTKIYYTSGSSSSIEDPTTASTEYTGKIAITATTYFKAIAVKDNFDNSSVQSYTATYAAAE